MRIKSLLMLGLLLTLACCQFEFLTSMFSSVGSTVGEGANTVGDAVGGAIGNLANGLQSSHEQMKQGVEELPKGGHVDAAAGKPASEDIPPELLPLQPQNKLQVELFASKYVPATPTIHLIRQVQQQPNTQTPNPSLQLQNNPHPIPQTIPDSELVEEQRPNEEEQEMANQPQSDVTSNEGMGRGSGLRHGGYMRRGREYGNKGGCKRGEGRGDWNAQMRRREIKSPEWRTKLDERSQKIETTTAPKDTSFLLIKSPEQYQQSLALATESQDIQIHP